MTGFYSRDYGEFLVALRLGVHCGCVRPPEQQSWMWLDAEIRVSNRYLHKILTTTSAQTLVERTQQRSDNTHRGFFWLTDELRSRRIKVGRVP